MSSAHVCAPLFLNQNVTTFSSVLHCVAGFCSASIRIAASTPWLGLLLHGMAKSAKMPKWSTRNIVLNEVIFFLEDEECDAMVTQSLG